MEPSFPRKTADSFGRTLWMIAIVFLAISAALWYLLGGERSSANATRILALDPRAAHAAARDAARAEGWRIVPTPADDNPRGILRLYARGTERFLLRPTDVLMVVVAPRAAKPGQSELFIGVDSNHVDATPLRDRLLARLSRAGVRVRVE